MAIDTYANLKTTLTARIGDAGLDSYLDDFIDLAEAYFNRTLRCSQMEERTTLTTDSNGRATLPTGFLAVRSARYNGSPLVELRNISMGGENRLSPYDTAGDPIWFSITSVSNVHKLRVTPIKSSAEIYLTYFEKVPALDSSTTTNWLLDLAPDAYLFECMAQAYMQRQAFDKAAGFHGQAQIICEELNGLDERARYGNAEITLTGVNP